MPASRTNLANTYPKIDITGLPPTAKARYTPDVIIRDFPNMGTHMVLGVSITHPCGDSNQPWVRQTAADARHASKHQRLRDHLLAAR